ncbi:hypothetical protein [Gulosibacter molinativorax]|uniref:Uncharacterized protein n=1 Tax=Gulosibacter molinativorax TaxID=256821 RepID=A0ABT7C815_9MICO|nr:hypothetical protein [Gulosibacter molinativorax]MDJ1371333.1 hypothetical protein [Gulosibacter molinativorax]QUY63603.1 Hypotetical protein [Gulosibacter molinativorax]
MREAIRKLGPRGILAVVLIPPAFIALVIGIVVSASEFSLWQWLALPGAVLILAGGFAAIISLIVAPARQVPLAVAGGLTMLVGFAAVGAGLLVFGVSLASSSGSFSGGAGIATGAGAVILAVVVFVGIRAAITQRHRNRDEHPDPRNPADN